MLKLSENLFAPAFDRSRTGESRKEDKFNPDYIDFGPDTSVYWTEYNYEIDEKKTFKYEEFREFNKDGWRLPTIDEVKELNWKSNNVCWYKGYITVK